MSVIGEDWKLRERVISCGPLGLDGTVKLARELLMQLGWDEGDVVLAMVSGDELGIELRRARSCCAHCGADVRLRPVFDPAGGWTGTTICEQCLQSLLRRENVDLMLAEEIYLASMGVLPMGDGSGARRNLGDGMVGEEKDKGSEGVEKGEG